MDNNQNFVPGQPISPAYAGPMTAQQPYQNPGGQPFQQPQVPGQVAQQTKTSKKTSKVDKSLVITIILIIVSLIAATFIGLFIWASVNWNDVQKNVDTKVDVAVAQAEHDVTEKLETEFAEKEKYPYKKFATPTDYGGLTFEYPKTWSVYIAKDAANGGDFEAYFAADQVQAIAIDNVYTLRVFIRDKDYESVVASYQSNVKNGKLTETTEPIGGQNATRLAGQITNKLRGYIAIIKIRDKTAILQTDAEIFKDDFEKILSTIQYNL